MRFVSGLSMKAACCLHRNSSSSCSLSIPWPICWQPWPHLLCHPAFPLPFETALAPILDIAACDGMADRIRGFEPLPTGRQLFLAIQAAPGPVRADVQRVRGAGLGPLDVLSSDEGCTLGAYGRCSISLLPVGGASHFHLLFREGLEVYVIFDAFQFRLKCWEVKH